MLNTKLTKLIDSKADQVSTSIKSAQNTFQNHTSQLTNQIAEANQTMKVAAPILKIVGHSEATQFAKGMDLAQKNLLPILDQTNKVVQKGTDIANSQIQKASNLANQQIQKVNEAVGSQLEQGQQIIKQQYEKGMEAVKENQNFQSIAAKGAAIGMAINQMMETPTDDGYGKINQQMDNTQQKQDQLQQYQQNRNVIPTQATINADFNKQQQKLEANSFQSTIKQYIKKITGKQVNSRIEYLCLILQKLKDNIDINYLQQSKEALKNEIWKAAYQERRIQSHQIFVQYMTKMVEFIFEYLTIVETVFQQIKMRYKSSNNSFDMMQNYLNNLSIQLDYFATYSYVQPNQKLLSRLFTNQTQRQDKQNQKKNKQSNHSSNQNINGNTQEQPQDDKDIIQQQYHLDLCQNFSNLESEYQQHIQNIQILKNNLKGEIKEKLIICQQMNKQKISDYLMQVQGQRNITFDAVEQFYKSFIQYEQIYAQNVDAAFQGGQQMKDIYDEEYKMHYYFKSLITQQKQFGLFTTYILKEISEFELHRIEFVQKLFAQLNTELGKYFQFPNQKTINFANPQILQQAITAFNINQLLTPEQLVVIKKYSGIPLQKEISTEIYHAFASNFTVPSPDYLLQQSPLILKKYSVQRDVAWERSLSFGKDFIPTNFIISVDGFLLFYDTDWKEQNIEEPLQCHNFMVINELAIKESQSDETLIELKVKKHGKLFNTHKKQILKMNDVMEKESLKILLNQFK
ncbi:unnamed protein product [Paramecium octaurelia]|uniref:Uncharacterized protein n=1 Tax=Paramecium octaurelia TaxID=43137 RepID=A0A8S1WTK8_PAROT|nr:unnamed protein product [Paramecium octaurelia]